MATTVTGDSSTHPPIPPTPLLGRQDDITAVLGTLLDPEVRLTTLTGPGGVGKTRLATAVIEHLRGAFRDGVHYVDLSIIEDPEQIVSTIALTLGVRNMGNQPIIEGLQSAFREQHMLLVLDNFEHLVPAAGEVAALLTECPQLKFLVTSRVPLHLRAEHVFPVQPLAIEHAVGLFAERAQAVDPEFGITPANADAVASICARLDGLPLALELAASRIRTLPPAALLTRLERLLPLLVGGARDLPARQQTMRDTINWSYALLSSQQQAIFRRLSVFPDSWTLEGAEAVCPATAEDLDVLSGLDALVSQGLVAPAREVAGLPRFTMLGTIKEFARDLLHAEGEVLETQSLHAFWVLERTEDLNSRRRIDPQSGSPVRYADVRAALAFFDEYAEPERHLRQAAVLGDFSYADIVPSDLFFSDLRNLLGRALERTPGIRTLERVNALWYAAFGAHMQGSSSDAVAHLDEALSIARCHGQTFELANVLLLLGQIAQEQEDYSLASTYFDEAIHVAETTGNERQIGQLRMFLALVASGLGEHQRAIELAESAVSTARGAGASPGLIANTIEVLGVVLYAAGHHVRAAEQLMESARSFVEQTAFSMLPLSLSGLASVYQTLGQSEPAATLLGYTEALCKRFNIVLFMPERAVHETAIAAARMSLGEERFREALEKGRTLSVETAIAFASETADRILAPTDNLATNNDPQHARLTQRELDVLKLIADGMTDREIADALFISPRTVTTHVTNILNKLGVASRSAAVAAAVRQGII